MFILDCNLPGVLTRVLAGVYKVILVAAPVGVLLFGVVDFIKGIASKDANDIKANSSRFIKRLITGLLTFFVLAIIKAVFLILQNAGVGDASSAMQCAISILGGN